MGAPDVLARVVAAGIKLTPLPDGRIWAEPSSKLTDELRALIRAHKPELLATLTPESGGVFGVAPLAVPPPDPAAEARRSETELRLLVNQIADAHGFSPEDRREALEVALRDSDRNRALTCYRVLAAEARRSRVLAMLQDNPTARYAVLTDTEADPEAVILTLAIRGRASCEFQIPREKWDGVLFLDLLERQCGTVH